MNGTLQLLRIFVSESQRSGDRALYSAIVDGLKEAGFGGATVFKGIEGYGLDGTVQLARAIETAPDLPVLIEVIDSEERIRAFLPALERMVDCGLITLEKIEAIRITGSKRA